jgi:hypothetical protein
MRFIRATVFHQATLKFLIMMFTASFLTFSLWKSAGGEQAAKPSGTSLRVLPSLFERQMSDGALVVVDSEVGAGSKDCPGGAAITHALSQVATSDTLYLREGRNSETSTAQSPICERFI